MKLSAISMTTPAFRGYKYIKNNYGDDCFQFGYPHDTGSESNSYREKCTLEIVPIKQNTQTKEWESAGSSHYFELPNEGGVAVDVKNLGFSKDVKYFAYRYHIEGEQYGQKKGYRKAFDTGRQENIQGKRFNVVSLTALKPTNIGPGILALTDSFAPGFVHKGFFEENVDDIGKIEFDKNLRTESEKAKRTFSNTLGGTLAGYTAKIKELKERGYSHLFSLPITGGDSISAFKYWPENLFQLAAGIGDMNNYQDLVDELYTNGMIFVMDAPLTSEAFSGVHYQYAIKWGQQDNPMKKWFRMEGIESDQVGYGIVGRNSQGLSHYLVNAPHKFIQKEDGTIIIRKNEDYDASKPTHMQYFDKDYMSETQLEEKGLIEKYDKMSHDNPLATATHDDTVVKFNHIITKSDYETYLRNMQKLSEINRTSTKEPIRIDSKEGTIYLSHLTKTKITEKNEAGVLTWVAHTDMIKYKYFDSNYDYKTENDEIVDAHGLTPSNCELIDQVEKYSTYWTKKTYDFQNLKTARELGNVKNAQEAKAKIDKLISEGKLPEQAALSLEALDNIDADLYNIDIPELSAEDFINKTSMGLIFETLTLSKDTLGVLSTDYFTDRATSYNTIGMNRYELAKAGNPHITEELNERYGYKKTYEKVNEMFTSEINDFIMGVLERANEDMPADRKIFKDATKNELTEYGYYVTKFIAEDIARYAFTKALVPNAQVKVNSRGQIIYNTEHLKENSSLQQIGIKAHTFKYEAELLAVKIKNGLRNVTTDSADIALMKDAVINRFKDTNANTFKYAEAMVKKAELGLTHRVDALKDTEDIDSQLNDQAAYSQFWPNVEFLWSRFKKGYEKFNPNGYIVDEITDSEDIGGNVIGTPWSIMVNSEHTSEAGYTYFFTDPIKLHSGDGAKDRRGNDHLKAMGIYGGDRNVKDNAPNKLIGNQLKFLLEQNFPLDYFRTLYNFSDNHDKPRLAHLLAIDPQLVHSDINHANNPYRDLALKMITGATEEKELPFDLIYHSGDTEKVDGTSATNYINNNYFLGASTLAIASGEIIRSKFHQFLFKKNLINEKERDTLHNAVTLLVNGYNTIEPEKRPSYMDYNTAFAEVLEIAEKNGLRLPNNAKEELINNIHRESRDIAIWILKEGHLRSFRNHFSNEKHSSASGQILTLANILMQATNVKVDDLNNLYKNNADNAYKNPQDIKAHVYNALSEYINKYPESFLQDERLQHQKFNMERLDNERNAFGVLDFRQAIDLVFEKAGMGDREDLKFEIFKSINDPIRMKRNMLMRMMISLPGVPTTYAGDEFNMSGWEEKTENLWLQCRNSLLWSKIEGDSQEAKYYREMLKEYNDIIKLRGRNGKLSALNTGTPYQLQNVAGSRKVDGNDIHTDLSAALTVDPDGSTVISLFNVSGLSHLNNAVYNDQAENPYIPVLHEISVSEIPLRTDLSVKYGELDNQAGGVTGFALASGMILKNVVNSDDTVYKVVKNGMEYVIRRFDQYGKQIDIVINNGTSQYGVFSLYKNIRKMPFFKGNSRTFSTPQYNIVANPNYFTEQKTNECGSKLSILAK